MPDGNVAGGVASKAFFHKCSNLIQTKNRLVEDWSLSISLSLCVCVNLLFFGTFNFRMQYLFLFRVYDLDIYFSTPKVCVFGILHHCEDLVEIERG